jgi:membrane-associated phospholipid phosphatase
MNFSARLRRCGLRAGVLLTLILPYRAAIAQATPQIIPQPAPDQESLPPVKIAATSAETPSVERAAFASVDSPGEKIPEPESIASFAVIPDTQNKTLKPQRCDIDSLGRCLKDLLDDEVGMWTSPLRIHKRDALWLLPLGALTAAALTTDASVSAAVGFNPARIRFSKDFSNAMEDGSIGAAAGLYLLGKITHNEKARETGVLGIEAVIDATIAVEVLKLATNRLRPNVGPRTGPFWEDDADNFTTNGSFPSGHSAIVWAVVHVISDETPGNTWLHIGLYFLAASTAVTRVTGQEHFPSDALVGSAIGYLVGGYVYRHHSAASGREGIPVMILPFSDARTRSTGIAMSLDPTSLPWKSPKELWSKLLGADSHLHRIDN